MNVEALLKTLSLMLTALDTIGLIRQQMVELQAHLQQMHDEGRDPTDAEWAEVNDKIKSLSDELAARAAAAQVG